MAGSIGKGSDVMEGNGAYSFEPLPVIAGERRLHVRAYHYWRARADGRAMPTLADCADLDQADFAGQMILVDLARGGQSARISTIGRALALETPTDDDAESGLLEQLLARLPTVALQRAPIGFEAELPEDGESGRCFRGILLPIADDSGAIAHILGVMSWRHVAAEMPGPDVLAAVASVDGARRDEVTGSPWSEPATARQARPAASTAELIAQAKTWAALAATDRTRSRSHLHAAVGAARDALAVLSAEEGDTLLETLFADGADLPLIRLTLGRAGLLALSGQELVRRLDMLPDGMASFVAPASFGGAQSATRPRFRLTPLGPELLAPPRRLSEQDAGDLLARRLAR